MWKYTIPAYGSRFVNEGGGLERSPGWLALQVTLCNPMQLPIDDGNQFVQHGAIASTQLFQEGCHGLRHLDIIAFAAGQRVAVPLLAHAPASVRRRRAIGHHTTRDVG
jgi:hypothetical protein